MPLVLRWDPLDLQTKHAFHIARASAPPVRSNVSVRVTDAAGREGWGEAAPSAFYGESADTVAAVMPRYAAVLEATDDDDALEQVEKRLGLALGGNGAARAAISAALHDLAGKRLNAPVWKLWGLAPAGPRSSFTIGIDEPAIMRERIAAAEGYDILKIKIGTDRDEDVLRIVREAVPSARIRVDANTAWTVKQAIGRLPLMTELGVELIEQPLRAGDLDGFRLLRDRSPIPIFADESCRTLADIPRLAGRVDGVNIKLSKCGSLREALRMVHAARAHDLLVMLGCMVESTLGIAAAVQLAPLCDFIDLDGAALLDNDPFTGPGIERDGTLRFNAEPGLGVGAA